MVESMQYQQPDERNHRKGADRLRTTAKVRERGQRVGYNPFRLHRALLVALECQLIMPVQRVGRSSPT